jgi:DNA-binding transcriptional regulator YdaS (Cro superfamily)
MPNNVGMEQISPIEKAVRIVGGLTALANMIGVSAPTVHEWKTLKRPVPVLRCVSISQATNGAVTLQDLRPDDWQKIWPELAQPAGATQGA